MKLEVIFYEVLGVGVKVGVTDIVGVGVMVLVGVGVGVGVTLIIPTTESTQFTLHSTILKFGFISDR
jgi:hypothetical protein